MFKVAYNRAVLTIEIRTTTPLLIKAGDPGLNPAGVDLTPMRTTHQVYGTSVFIPGSSLKGVVRSASESMVRGRTIAAAVPGACDAVGSRTCGQRLSKEDRFKEVLSENRGAVLHRKHCAACRTFGSTMLKGRVSFRDLFPWRAEDDEAANEVRVERANQLEVRHGVAINRLSGAVQHGPFDQELVPSGTSFFGEVALENYQVWQLGLIAAAFEELNEGFAQLGSSKSRGLGGIKAYVLRIVHEQSLAASETPLGVARLAPEVESQYGMLREGNLPATNGVPRGIRRRFEVESAATSKWFEAGLRALGNILEEG